MNASRFPARGLAVGMFVLVAGCAGAGGGSISPTPVAVYRVYDTGAEEYLSVAQLVDRVRDADVVLFGELHDDVVAHRIQLEVIERLAADSTERALGLEMFERDVQSVIDDYVLRRIDEGSFLGSARPWQNYPAAYRPLVETARAHRWPIEATNMPQETASSIARYGTAALGSLSLDQRRHVAAELQCPEDGYWTRFQEAMQSAADTDSTAHAAVDPFIKRTYEAQCARDETMAETISALLPGIRVLHINGGFHSDFHMGIVPRILRRVPAASIRTISAFPVDDLTDPPIEEHARRADFLIFTTTNILGALGE
jgi:uncharacterized iron-regulated protein